MGNLFSRRRRSAEEQPEQKAPPQEAPAQQGGGAAVPEEKSDAPAQEAPAQPAAVEPAVDPAPAEPEPEPPAQEEPADPPAPEQPAEDPAPAVDPQPDPAPEDPPAQEPAVEDPAPAEPAAEPAVEEPPVEEPAAVDPPVEPAVEPAPEPAAEPPVEEPPAEEPPAEEPPAEEPPAEEPPADVPAVEEPAVEEPAVEEPPVEEPPVEEPAVEEPVVEEPAAEPIAEPVAEDPAPEEPPAEAKEDAVEPPVPAVDVEPEPAVDPVPQIVERKEIRAMSRPEQDRFFDAVFKMMENSDGPGTSEYFRIAGYHGNPGNAHCAHGVEAFPGWHRIYLIEFQNALQAADRALGNDGNIGLAYWDWSVDPDSGLPDIVRERFSEFPEGLFPNNSDAQWPTLRRYDNRGVASRLRRGRVVENARGCLLATQHWAHASTANSRRSRYPSLETSHNMVHVSVGVPMNSVAWAAFDICFWLHHCNIDRVYEGYLELEPDSAEEFEAFQNRQRRDLYDKEFEPFRKPDGSRYSPADTFSTVALGYRYTDVPTVEAQAMQEAPTYAIFEQIRIVEMNGSCYELHVFAVPNANVDDWTPPEDPMAYDDDPTYAGAEAIFGKGPECEACLSRPPFDLRVELSDVLRNQGVSRYDVTLKVMVVETTDNNAVRPLEETPVPPPIIDGPLFDDRESPLEEATKDTARPEDVRALQEYLQMFGYYGDALDGDFGPVTDKAVRKYQEMAGLDVDGQVGPITKKQMLNAARCGERDVDEGATVDNVADLEFAAPRDQGPYYGGRTDVTYSVGRVPGYLPRDGVLVALGEIFTQYGEASGLTFNLSDDEEKSDIKVSWTMGDNSKGVKFDGSGGVLARGGEGFLQLDEAERWTLNADEAGNLEDRSTWRRGDPVVLFQHVALHELGHALGLGHSNDRDDVMAPYYNPGMVVLSGADQARVGAIYGRE